LTSHGLGIYNDEGFKIIEDFNPNTSDQTGTQVTISVPENYSFS
jgi:hypothetical protein